MIKSPVDPRDFYATYFLDRSVPIPSSYKSPKTRVRFQWGSGQCVCFAVTQAMSQYEKLHYGKYSIYSPGLLYANREDDDFQGEGWYVRKALKQLNHYGTVLESEFPFPEAFEKERDKFLNARENLLKKASSHKISAYFKCENTDDVKRCIMQKGCVITSSVCNPRFFLNFNVSKRTVEGAQGGHAYIIIGWDESGWIAQDSYGLFRPILGRFHIDYDFPLEEFWGIEMNK